jgi:hypothetical protein
MRRMVDLPIGDHELSLAVQDWKPDYVHGSHPPKIELIASIQSDPMVSGHLSRGTTATTLAIQMDAQTALRLYEKLGMMGRSRGWLPTK